MDNRAHIKIKMSLYGKEFKWDTSINYMGWDGVDDRVVEWFERCWNEAYTEYRGGIEKMAEEEQEARELEEYGRLKKKYGKGKYDENR